MNKELNNTLGSLMSALAGEPSFSDIGQRPFSNIGQRRVAGISLDTRDVKSDWVFVALQGAKEHGLEHLKNLKGKKLAAVLLDKSEATLLKGIGADEKATIPYYEDTPVIMIDDLRSHLSDLGKNIYDVSKMQWIGVTGTNGKSSITHMLGQSLSNLGAKTAVIGGVYNGFTTTQDVTESSLTTPDILTLCRYGDEFKKQGAAYIALECSSHGLRQKRTDGLNFVCGVFTNLTTDHTDYHANMDEYEASKFRLFEYPELKYSVINYADPVGVRWYEKLKSHKECLSYGSPKADIFAEDVKIGNDFTSFNVSTPQGKGMANIQTCSLWGVDNALATLGVLIHLEYRLPEALDAISESVPLSGRMQKVSFTDHADFIIDYAHSPDALLRTLQSARQQLEGSGNLWVVFGCGGDRDIGKRKIMGKIADEYADKIILTDDNPRYEEPSKIVSDIMAGINKNDPLILHDRGEAIHNAFTNAKPNDLVVVAGKGHESYQDSMGEKRKFNDYEFVTRTLN